MQKEKPEDQSFFDDETAPEQEDIWSPSLVTDPQAVEIDLAQYFWQDKEGTFRRIFVSVFESQMYVMTPENPDLIQGRLDILTARIFPRVMEQGETIDPSLSGPINGFRIWKQHKFIDIYCEDEQAFNEWKAHFAKRAILTTFHEDFHVLKQIGRGSFACVYLVERKGTNERYAVKAFNQQNMLKQLKGRESIINEISVMRSVNSPHLLKLYEVHETKSSLYMVVEILEGGELLERLKKRNSITEYDAKVLIKNLLKGLNTLHQQGIMHRDLKPENLILRSETTHSGLVVVDFGLATRVDVKDMIFKRCGTPGYVAPEILRWLDGKDMYNAKCDIFSAGVIFYIILTGRQPFAGNNYNEILQKNQMALISFAGQDLQRVPAESLAILKLLLEFDPNQRPSAAELLEMPYFKDNELDEDGLPPPSEILQIGDKWGSINGEFKKNLKNMFDMASSQILQSTGQIAITGNMATQDRIDISVGHIPPGERPKRRRSTYTRRNSAGLPSTASNSHDDPVVLQESKFAKAQDDASNIQKVIAPVRAILRIKRKQAKVQPENETPK